jgi:hypothetical protein
VRTPLVHPAVDVQEVVSVDDRCSDQPIEDPDFGCFNASHTVTGSSQRIHFLCRYAGAFPCGRPEAGLCLADMPPKENAVHPELFHEKSNN